MCVRLDWARKTFVMAMLGVSNQKDVISGATKHHLAFFFFFLVSVVRVFSFYFFLFFSDTLTLRYFFLTQSACTVSVHTHTHHCVCALFLCRRHATVNPFACMFALLCLLLSLSPPDATNDNDCNKQQKSVGKNWSWVLSKQKVIKMVMLFLHSSFFLFGIGCIGCGEECGDIVT